MDPRDFDRFARLIGSGQSRRWMLKTLAGGALGAVAAAAGFGEAGATHRLRSAGNTCSRNADCASALCVAEGGTRKICCQPDDQAATCAGQCGPVTNNCGQSVDCGVCFCPSGSSLCEHSGANPTCCGGGSSCSSCISPGDCSCCASSGGQCRYCAPGSFVCCTGGFDSGTCTCCSSGQTCTDGVCSA